MNQSSKPEIPQPFKRFILMRKDDVTGISGTGVVGVGVLLPDRQAILHWMTEVHSTVIYPSIANVEYIHGHDGKTVVLYIDEEAPQVPGWVKELAARVEKGMVVADKREAIAPDPATSMWKEDIRKLCQEVQRL